MNNKRLLKMIFTCNLIALFFVLGNFCTYYNGSIKITPQNLPLYIGAIVLGPSYGALIGFAGTLLSQYLSYGFDILTPLWVLPHTLIGFVFGVVIKKNNKLINCGIKFLGIMVTFQVILTIINTIVIIIDSLVKAYFNPLNILAPFIVRIMAAVIVGILYGIIIPPIYNAIKKIH